MWVHPEDGRSLHNKLLLDRYIYFDSGYQHFRFCYLYSDLLVSEYTLCPTYLTDLIVAYKRAPVACVAVGRWVVQDYDVLILKMA
jgi:hypothetical protein